MKRQVIKLIKFTNLAYLYMTLATNVGAIGAQFNRRHRRWGIRPINKKKDSEELFSTLFKDMWNSDDEQFFKYTRMSQIQFLEILRLIGKDLQKFKKRRHISPQERLLITLQ